MSKNIVPSITYKEALSIAQEKMVMLDHLDEVSVGPDFLPESLVYLRDETMDRTTALLKAAEIELENMIKTGSADSFDKACVVVGDLIVQGKALSNKMVAAWAGAILKNQVPSLKKKSKYRYTKRPRQHGQSLQENYFRNEAIIKAIKALYEKGLLPERKAKDRQKSIKSFHPFDVVKTALSKRGINLGYKAIEAIWYKHNTNSKSKPLKQ